MLEISLSPGAKDQSKAQTPLSDSNMSSVRDIAVLFYLDLNACEVTFERVECDREYGGSHDESGVHCQTCQPFWVFRKNMADAGCTVELVIVRLKLHEELTQS